MTAGRRLRDLGPPHQVRERRVCPSGRRANDALKMACPYCGWSVSAIVRSRGGIVEDKVHRRRECAECGRLFSTAERVDREQLEQELEDAGALASAPAFAEPPVTWENAEALVHRLWGQAKDRAYVKSDWMALQHVLAGLRRAQA